MGEILAFLEDLVSGSGWWGIGLIVAALVLFIIQLWYYVGQYGRIPSYRAPKAEDDERRPVSVVIVLQAVDYTFLDNTLPVLLGQQHDGFEVVLVDLTGDVEFSEALGILSDNNPRLTTTRFVNDPRFPISNKMALNVGIKAASYENIVITTTESVPSSEHWVARMARGFGEGDLVLGYCGMEAVPGFAGRMMRLGRVGVATRWLSAALRGKPYRGTLHNLGFTKSLYYKHGGFNFLNMNIGEDDLFIQHIAPGARTAVVLSSNAMTRQHPWGGLGWWYAQRKFYSHTFRYYPKRVKRYVRTEQWSRVLFFAVCAAMAILMPFEVKIFAGGLFLLRFIIVFFEMSRVFKRLSEKGLRWLFPLYDLFQPFYEAMLAIGRFGHKRTPGLWR